MFLYSCEPIALCSSNFLFNLGFWKLYIVSYPMKVHSPRETEIIIQKRWGYFNSASAKIP
jgi:hypothetical protein